MSAIFEPVISGDLTVQMYLLCLLCAGICGVLAALAAGYRSRVSKGFLISLVLLPMIVSTVIAMVNGNVGTGVAVMGAFSLVRFRSVPGKAKDIAAIFLAMTAGLACAAGFVGIALLFTAIVCLAMCLLSHIPMGQDALLELHITVPETLCFSTAFDDLFSRFTRSHRLIKVKTGSMGSLYKLQYQIRLKDAAQAQAFIDALRCRNGNLEIAILEAAEGCDVL